MAKKETMKMDTLQMLSWVLVTVGALNWGLVGIANVNLVELLFGMWPALVQIVYILVGLAGVYSLWGMFTMKK
jgi:uncharacterized protein